MKTLLAVTALTLTLPLSAQQPEIPEGYWPESKSAAILEKTETIRLAPDLSRLSAEEQAAVKELLEAGILIQRLYEQQRHPDALKAFEELRRLDARAGSPPRTKNLRELYRLFQGPIATTLDNKREAFLPVSAETPGKNVYPSDLTKAELDAFLAKNPAMRDRILAPRTVVRRETKSNLANDINPMTAFPVLRYLSSEVYDHLRSRQLPADGSGIYAVPYSITHADQTIDIFIRLTNAAARVESQDSELARYLRNRARDFLSNDYESGDASWITGRFKRLNAQIGAYETYDDALYGVKAFYGMSVLIENEKATAELRKALTGLQAIEDALPYDAHKRVREDIPIGVYEVIADFGQARGTNTATILPNDALFSRRYGRRIMLRENIMTHPNIVAANERVWRAATADAHAKELGPEGNVHRTLWHEIGHYLGADRTKDGRELDVALESYADALEEMKSDLVSLFALQRMNHPSLRAIQASGIRRTLQNVKPRPDQPYQTMQLIQFNWFLDKGLLSADPKTARLSIHYDRYPEAVNSLLKEVLKLQHDGDKAAAAAFFERWTTWTPEVHDKLAARIREAEGARWRLVRYAALGE
ncbi:MAG TPA: NUDIX hydrolase [Thermoanaerobaculia bacterium]|nr:NUDIX hydrolase [Thermoanaerobaculia bacterium]